MIARLAATCPLCESPLRRRSGANGAFLGCTNFPRCKLTEDYDAAAEETLRVARDEYKYYRDLLELARKAVQAECDCATCKRIRSIVSGPWLVERVA